MEVRPLVSVAFKRHPSDLTNFGDGGVGTDECESGFLNVPVSAGTISGFITNTALERSDENWWEQRLGRRACARTRGKLTGVLTLTTPVVVTSDTLQVIFNFSLTNQGAQFFDDANNSGVPDQFGSGPFSGSFTIVNK